MDPNFLMRQMKMDKLNVDVLFIKKDGKWYKIESPEIVQMALMGQSFTIINNFNLKEVDEEDLKELCKVEEFNEEDVKFVAEQLNVSEEKAKELLKKTKGDIALAIELGEKEKNENSN